MSRWQYRVSIAKFYWHLYTCGDNKTWHTWGVSMDRDEILAQSRLENRRWDECERRMADEAGTWGIIAVAAAVVCVFLIRMFSEGGNPYDLLAILFVYLAAANAYKWNKTRSRWTLLVTMLYAVIAIGSLCAYAIAG
ncbi:DUF6442 family protein [Slackia piriformis]|uniref:DUF6442 family protein n=2 Tax=Slackia piriformis TaxID=626934 RepID=UPI002F929244